MPGSGRKTIEIALFTSFALSGAAALIAQTVWQRELVRLVGATTPSAAVVYAGVMAGLGAGALLGNAVLARGGGLFSGVNPLRFFAVLEAIACAFALLYAVMFRAGTFTVGPLVSLSSLGDETVRQALAFLLVAAPALAMGATWPAAIAAAEKIAIDVGKATTILYTTNLFGALLGVASGAFFLIPSFGLSVTLGTAGALNVTASVIALVLSLVVVKLISPRNSIDMAASSHADEVMPQFDCLLVFLSAAATLALEVVFTRLFTLILGSSTYSIGIVLCGVIFGLYASSPVGWVLMTTKKAGVTAKSMVAFVASGAALLIFAEACLINKLPDLVLYFSELAFSSKFQDLPLFRTFIFPRMMICLCVVVLPVAFTSAVFPAVLAGSLKQVNAKTARASWLYSASTLGAVVGSLGAGLYLIPAFSERYESGLLASLIVVAGVCLLIAALAASHQISIATKKEKQSGVVFLCAAAIIGLVSTLYPPRADTFLLSQGLGLFPIENEKAARAMRASIELERKSASVVFYREGLNTTVTVEEMPKKNISVLKSDGKVEAAMPQDLARPAPTSDYPTQMLLGLLPYILSPKDKLNSLVIGCGSGATYGALAKQKNVLNLTVAEIEKAVFEASQFFLPFEKKTERADIRKVVCDARSFLSYTANTYDLIVSQPAEPWVNGAGDLYTQEFFQLVASRLAKGGVFCQWLQLYSIDEKTLLVLLNTIQRELPATYVFHPHGSGEILIVSFAQTIGNAKASVQPVKDVSDEAKLDVARIEKLIGEPALKSKLGYCHLESSADLLSMLVLTPLSLDELLWKKLSTERISVNTDDNLKSEYALPYQLMNKDDRIEKNLELLHSVRSNLLTCLKGLPEDAAQKAEFVDRVALSMARFSQKHVGEGLDDAALAAAFEGWTLSESPTTAAACDVVSYMTGRFETGGASVKSIENVEAPTAAQAFWLAQAEALKGNKDKAVSIVRQGLANGGPRSGELEALLQRLTGK